MKRRKWNIKPIRKSLLSPSPLQTHPPIMTHSSLFPITDLPPLSSFPSLTPILPPYPIRTLISLLLPHCKPILSLPHTEDKPSKEGDRRPSDPATAIVPKPTPPQQTQPQPTQQQQPPTAQPTQAQAQQNQSVTAPVAPSTAHASTSSQPSVKVKQESHPSFAALPTSPGLVSSAIPPSLNCTSSNGMFGPYSSGAPNFAKLMIS